jgi:dTDP-4-dehydrorhamnose reductase
MIKVLVTGANGQLGQCIKDVALDFPECDIFFASRQDLDIEKEAEVKEFFRDHSFDYCINTAAYTNVEKAESESDAAFSINAEAVKNLSEVCKNNNVVLLHISTDYVFDGKQGHPYVETDITNPINVYGASKLKGEHYIENSCDKYFIFRTSWLYSQYGHNFFNTILKYAKGGKPLTITTEQTGTPTNANDFANIILKVIQSGSTKYGLYHFSNQGEATWYDFAKEILNQTTKLEHANLGKSDHYLTFAARPKYSVLDKSKICITFDFSLIYWRKSLETIIISNRENNF